MDSVSFHADAAKFSRIGRAGVPEPGENRADWTPLAPPASWLVPLPHPPPQEQVITTASWAIYNSYGSIISLSATHRFTT